MDPLRFERPFDRLTPVHAPEDADNRIKAVVDGFNAERVHAVMEVLGWRWGGSDMPVAGVPTVEQIRAKAVELLRGTLSDFAAGKIAANGGWGSGGLRTLISDKGELTVWFELCFCSEHLYGTNDKDQPVLAGYLCVGEARTWRKS